MWMRVVARPLLPQGLELGYEIKIVEPTTEWKFNVGELARCVEGGREGGRRKKGG